MVGDNWGSDDVRGVRTRLQLGIETVCFGERVVADDATLLTAMASWLGLVALLSALLAIVTASPGFGMRVSRFVELDRRMNSRKHLLCNNWLFSGR